MSLDAELADELAGWPVGSAGVLVLDRGGVVGAAGDVTSVRPWASVTKILTAITALQAVADGVTALDEPAGPPGATVRHLLAHASGLAMDSDRRLAEPGRRRIYSNRGIELVAQHVEHRAGRPFPDLLAHGVLSPLGLDRTTLEGSPAHGASGPVTELGRLAQELLRPRALAPELVTLATTIAFPGLGGVLPGFGHHEVNDWGLGLEIRGHKTPHWTSELNAGTTFGHFGQSGSFLWVDPEAAMACVSAGDTIFGPWAAEHWPKLSALVLGHAETARGDA